jgi:hypothetical protein
MLAKNESVVRKTTARVSDRTCGVGSRDEGIVTFDVWMQGVGSTIHSLFGRTLLFVCIRIKAVRDMVMELERKVKGSIQGAHVCLFLISA